jgi:hypothetical protein
VFVHVGGEVVVDVREVVAILDVRRLHRTAEARALLTRAGAGRAGHDEPRAIIVTTRGLHATPMAAGTVARRMGNLGRLPAGATAE